MWTHPRIITLFNHVNRFGYTQREVDALQSLKRQGASPEEAAGVMLTWRQKQADPQMYCDVYILSRLLRRTG